MTPDWLRENLLEMQAFGRVCSVYEKLYAGSTEEHFASDRIRKDLQDSGYYPINYARSAVDVPLERTKISGIVTADGRARTVLEDFWNLNELDLDAHKVHELAYEFGSSMIIAMPDEQGVMEAFVHSPMDVAVFYDPSRPRIKSHAIQVYTQRGDENGQDSDALYLNVVVYDAEKVTSYVSQVALIQGAWDYQTIELRLVDEIDNPVPGIIPVFHFRTARTQYGRSRLADAAGPQLAINDTMTAMMASVKAAGYRQRYMTVDNQAGGADVLDNPDYSGADDGVREENELISGPDTVQVYSGKNINLGTFDVSQSDNFTNALSYLVGALSKVTDTPEHYYTNGSTAPSGESYRQGERPLQAVVDHCQSLFAATWKDMFAYILAYYNVGGEAEVAWGSMVADDLDFWQVQTEKRSLGVPDKVLLVEGGYSQEDVDQWDVDAQAKAAEEAAQQAVVVPDPNAPVDDTDLIPKGTTPSLSE